MSAARDSVASDATLLTVSNTDGARFRVATDLAGVLDTSNDYHSCESLRKRKEFRRRMEQNLAVKVAATAGIKERVK